MERNSWGEKGMRGHERGEVLLVGRDDLEIWLMRAGGTCWNLISGGDGTRSWLPLRYVNDGLGQCRGRRSRGRR